MSDWILAMIVFLGFCLCLHGISAWRDTRIEKIKAVLAEHSTKKDERHGV